MKKEFGQAERHLRQARETSAREVADNVAHVENQIAAVARGDYAAAVADAWPDVTLDIFGPPEFHWLSKARGTQELQAALAHNFDSVEDQRPEITNVIAQADLVMLFGREQGRIRRTGERYDVEFVHRFTFREGRLAAIRIIAARAG